MKKIKENKLKGKRINKSKASSLQRLIKLTNYWCIAKNETGDTNNII